jgi:hypothetical protein
MSNVVAEETSSKARFSSMTEKQIFEAISEKELACLHRAMQAPLPLHQPEERLLVKE